MKDFLLLLTALCAGGLLPIQGALNADLSKALNHPLQASFISFLGALVAIISVLAFIRPEIPTLAMLKSIRAVNFTGGVFGVVFVTMILVLAPRIGIANTLIAAIVGQMIVSVTLDHFGLLGLRQHPVTMTRVLGCAGLLVSLYLVQKP